MIAMIENVLNMIGSKQSDKAGLRCWLEGCILYQQCLPHHSAFVS